MAIQNRRGDYANFDPQKMKPGEFAIVQSNDPNASDGKAVYICTQAGTVKRLVSSLELYDEVQNAATEIGQEIGQEIHDVVDEDVNRAETAANTATQKATEASESVTEIEGLIETLVDDSLSETGKAADAKATGDAIKAKAVTSLAERLYGGEYVSESEPYHFRQAPEGMGAKSETIVGGSLAWNQLCNGSSVTVQSGHKYIAKISGSFSIGASTGTAITGLTSGTDMVTDLTALFGTTIADYIYSLETANAGAGVAWVKRYIDLDTYHEYDAGSIQSVEGLVSHDVVGFNQWDEEWELGYLSLSTGEELHSTTRIRTKNFQTCFENTQYYVSLGQSYEFYLLLYDADKNFISASLRSNGVYQIPSKAKYFKFYMVNQTTYNHDICINLSDPSRNGTYEPYEKHSYPLGPTVKLNGVFKLVGDHLEADGDRWYSDKGIERRYGIVDLGTQSWRYRSEIKSGMFSLDIDIKANAQRVVCLKYPYMGTVGGVAAIEEDKTISAYAGGNIIYIYDTDYTNLADFKTAMSGVMLVYPLATPTTESVQPFQSPMIVGATEEYVTTGVVPVGHESKYYEDVAKKVSGLPKDFSTLIAPVEVTFTATRNYSVGSYLIVKNQLYKVTSAISSGGTITPNSNVTATTIMAEIMTLQ